MVTGWPNLANPADSVFYFILGIALTFLFLNTAVMIYFLIRYSRKRNPKPEDVKENLTIEILWTVIPTILVLLIFFAGWKGFQYMRTVPPDAMPVKVTARQWSWLFTYENGKQDSVLRVPLRKPVKLLITSADVLHSLFIPAYRIKEDCVPGMETHLWFLPDEVGSYDLFCTEYCGIGHSAMITKVEVVTQKDFDDWYQGEKKMAQAEGKKPAGKVLAAKAAKKTTAKTGVPGSKGAELTQVKGCVACHTTDGTPKIGPTFKGVFGMKETVIRDGKERDIVVDETFIKQTLLQPELDRVKGFPPIMPSMRGQLTDKEMDEIIEYIKSLK
ncbi:MAG TPA: cytochrome c oxidase subunit II [Nitrospirota bacterium]|nr:cytochrome c oxidase subunit II [Nitrospirota bacterium]